MHFDRSVIGPPVHAVARPLVVIKGIRFHSKSPAQILCCRKSQKCAFLWKCEILQTNCGVAGLGAISRDIPGLGGMVGRYESNKTATKCRGAFPQD